MTSLTLSKLDNAARDLQTIDDFANSAAPTITTRGGAVVPSRAGLTAEYPQATAQAAIATQQAQTAVTQAQAAVNAASSALAAQVAAQAARDSLNTTGKVFTAAEGTAAGVAATVNGQQFSVLSVDLLSWTVYRNNGGSALPLAQNYTKAYFDSILQRPGTRSWAHAVTDAAGKLAFGVTNAGKFILGVGGDIVSRIGTNETEIAAQKAQFARSVRGTKYIWRVVDAAQTKIALAVDSAGNLIAKGRDVLAELDSVKVLSAARAAVLQTDSNGRAPARVAVVDATGKSPFYFSRAGRPIFWGRDLLAELDAAAVGSAQSVRGNGTYLAIPYVDGAGKRQIKTLRKADGRMVRATAAGNNIDPFLTVDNYLMFSSDASGAYVQRYCPADGGTILDAVASTDYACWGDSLTLGAGTTPYPAQLAAALGRDVYNGGVGGQTSAEIAARQGGAPALLTVDSNLIPASGAVNVTAWSVRPLTAQGLQTMTGTLAGVPGTLTRVGGADTFTFTRSANGAAVACPAGSPFLPDGAVQYRGRTAILIYGRNDSWSDPTVILNSLAASVAYLSPYFKQFVVGFVLNTTVETIGSTAYNQIQAVNAAIAAAYPNNYVDTRSPPTNAEMTALGFVPSSADLTDIANGCIPTGMRLSNVDFHLNTIGYALQVLRIKNFIQSKGW